MIPQPTDTSKRCPLTARTGRIAAVAYKDLEIKVTVLDADGRKFDNISTLDLKWSLNSNDLGSLKMKTGVEYPEVIHPDHGIRMAVDPIQTLIVNSKIGPVDISATLKKSAYLGFGSVKESLQINLVNDGTANPSSLIVFNHPNNVETLTVKDGSGFFEVVNPNTNIALTQFHATNQSVTVKPKTDGDVVLNIKDLCLRANKSPVVKVLVSGNVIWKMLLIHEAGLQTHYFNTGCPSVENFKIKQKSLPTETGLSEGIIDNSCLVLIKFQVLILFEFCRSFQC